jgi:hypothetical protein
MFYPWLYEIPVVLPYRANNPFMEKSSFEKPVRSERFSVSHAAKAAATNLVFMTSGEPEAQTTPL